jgi:hypothetical protein
MEKKVEMMPCIYCGLPTDNQKFIINPKAEHELPCCSGDCYKNTKVFIEWDVANRMKGYLLIAVCVVFNLFSLGFEWTYWWRYFSLTGIGTILIFYPLIFSKYTFYQKYGIKKTICIIRYIGIGIILASFVFMAFG